MHNMKFSKELIKGSTKGLVLAAIGDNEMYGYQIIKVIKERSSDALAFGEGSIYPALHALEKDGLVESKWLAQENLPDRKYYSLTDKGRSKLKLEVAEWKEFTEAVNGIYSGISKKLLLAD